MAQQGGRLTTLERFLVGTLVIIILAWVVSSTFQDLNVGRSRRERDWLTEQRERALRNLELETSKSMELQRQIEKIITPPTLSTTSTSSLPSTTTTGPGPVTTLPSVPSPPTTSTPPVPPPPDAPTAPTIPPPTVLPICVLRLCVSPESEDQRWPTTTSSSSKKVPRPMTALDLSAVISGTTPAIGLTERRAYHGKRRLRGLNHGGRGTSSSRWVRPAPHRPQRVC